MPFSIWILTLKQGRQRIAPNALLLIIFNHFASHSFMTPGGLAEKVGGKDNWQ
jgi:hypothetical protein